MKRLIFLVLFLFLGFGPGQAEEASEPLKEIDIVHRWGTNGSSRLKVQSSERSSSVKSVFLHTTLKKRGWKVDLQGQTDGSRTEVEVSTRKQLLGQSGTYLKWKHDNGQDLVETGLETSVFGADKIRLSHRLAPLELEPSPRTELSYQRQFAGSKTLKALVAKSRGEEEIGGELLHEEPSGLMWGASLKSRRPSGTESWSEPQLEANFRFTW